MLHNSYNILQSNYNTRCCFFKENMNPWLQALALWPSLREVYGVYGCETSVVV